MRVDMASRQVVDFAVNKINGPATKLPHSGFERPSHCQFGPDGSLYVVDWGQIDIAPEVGGIRAPLGSGALWRIRRTSGRQGTAPARPREVPLHALQAVGVLAGLVLVAAVVAWVVRRLSEGLPPAGRPHRPAAALAAQLSGGTT